MQDVNGHVPGCLAVGHSSETNCCGGQHMTMKLQNCNFSSSVGRLWLLTLSVRRQHCLHTTIQQQAAPGAQALWLQSGLCSGRD